MAAVPGQGTAAGQLPSLRRGDIAGDVRGQAVRSRPDAALTRSGSATRAVDPQGRITALPCLPARLALDERAELRGAFASRSSSDRTHGVRLLLDLLFGDPARRPRRGGRGKGGHGPAARRRGAPLRRPSRQRQGFSHVPFLNGVRRAISMTCALVRSCGLQLRLVEGVWKRGDVGVCRLEMCGVEEARVVRRLGQAFTKASAVAEPHLPFIAGRRDGQLAWIGANWLDPLAAEAAWPPSDSFFSHGCPS